VYPSSYIVFVRVGRSVDSAKDDGGTISDVWFKTEATGAI
jgi:hypothetical protein